MEIMDSKDYGFHEKVHLYKKFLGTWYISPKKLNNEQIGTVSKKKIKIIIEDIFAHFMHSFANRVFNCYF